MFALVVGPSSASTTFYLRCFANFIDHLRARRVHMKNCFHLPLFLITICNGNRTEWSTIQGVIG